MLHVRSKIKNTLIFLKINEEKNKEWSAIHFWPMGSQSPHFGKGVARALPYGQPNGGQTTHKVKIGWLKPPQAQIGQFEVVKPNP
jgi:hypothetical protein